MKSHSIFLEALSLTLPALVAATAQLPYRWYYFLCTGAVLVTMPFVYLYIGSSADGPGGPGALMAAVLLMALMPGMHVMKLLIWTRRSGSPHGPFKITVWAIACTLLVAAVVTACISQVALILLLLVVGPALIQATVQLPYGERYQHVNAAALAFGGLALYAGWKGGSFAAVILFGLGAIMAFCYVQAHAVKALMWLPGTRWPALRCLRCGENDAPIDDVPAG